jgi:hypothetical protein
MQGSVRILSMDVNGASSGAAGSTRQEAETMTNTTEVPAPLSLGQKKKPPKKAASRNRRLR